MRSNSEGMHPTTAHIDHMSADYKNEVCKSVGTDWVNLRAFGGVHEFFKDDEEIQRLISDIKLGAEK